MTATASAPISGGVRRERARVRGRLCAGVDDQRARHGRAERLGHRPSLIESEEDALAGRAAREDAVRAVRLEEGGIRRDRALVDAGAAIGEGRDRSDDEGWVVQLGEHRPMLAGAAGGPAVRARGRRVESVAGQRRVGAVRLSRGDVPATFPQLSEVIGSALAAPCRMSCRYGSAYPGASAAAAAPSWMWPRNGSAYEGAPAAPSISAWLPHTFGNGPGPPAGLASRAFSSVADHQSDGGGEDEHDGHTGNACEGACGCVHGYGLLASRGLPRTRIMGAARSAP